MSPGEAKVASPIALYMPSFSGGGAEYVMVMLANAFAARQLPVDLVVAHCAGEHRDKVSNAVRVVDLKSRRIILSLPPLCGTCDGKGQGRSYLS